MVDLGDWNELLAPLFKDERYLKIRQFLIDEYRHRVIYPDMYDLYNCFRYTQFRDLKAVLLGQDPYHNEGQAHGLCFSVRDGVEKPPSLENIFKELKDDIGCDIPESGDLTKWAKEGVLLMNTSLTVRAHQANSHSKCGWAWFTDSVIRARLREKGTRRIYPLGRKCAKQKAAHRPQQTSRSRMRAPFPPPPPTTEFFGCRHFSKANTWLEEHGISPIDWDLTK